MSHAPAAARADTRQRPHPAPVGLLSAWPGWWAGLRDALHAEWTKLRTVAGTAWLLAAIVTLTIALSAVAVAATKCAPRLGGSAA